MNIIRCFYSGEGETIIYNWDDPKTQKELKDEYWIGTFNDFPEKKALKYMVARIGGSRGESKMETISDDSELAKRLKKTPVIVERKEHENR